MAYNTKAIVKDVEGNPISQYYNPTTDQYEPVEGSYGANKVVLYNADGTENNQLSLVPILDKLSQLTGTVIDEETRKSNELQRQEFYNQLQQMLASGELNGEQGIQGIQGEVGKGLEFNWIGTSLGVRVEGDLDYIYVDLKGDTGSIENITSEHVTNALGYTPIKSVNGEIGEEIIIDIPQSVEVVDNLTSEDESKALSANQGKILNENKLDKSGDTIQNYREKLVTLTGLAPDVDLSLANVFKLTLEGATTLSISNPSVDVSQSFTLIIIQPSTAYTVTFPTSIKWMNETIPDLSAVSKTYYLLFDTIDGGATWHGRFGGAF